ncbi:MAG: hypothetical protein Ct9H300mP14_06350 [Gammaproteobacteria bacterium]|nr:MAG: hypothetical protein Ct9H300mP14_06350 [Gammaproteobacteria bacterium]
MNMLAMISRVIPLLNRYTVISGSILSRANMANIRWWMLPTDPLLAITAMTPLVSESQLTALSTSVQTASS